MLTSTTVNLAKTADTDMIGVTQATNRSSNLAKAKAAAKGMSEEKIDSVSQEFEAQFISQMLSNMFATVDTKESLGGSDAEDTYRSMMVDQYGTMISRAGGIGVADYVKREMLKMQEVER